MGHKEMEILQLTLDALAFWILGICYLARN